MRKHATEYHLKYFLVLTKNKVSTSPVKCRWVKVGRTRGSPSRLGSQGVLSHIFSSYIKFG